MSEFDALFSDFDEARKQPSLEQLKKDKFQRAISYASPKNPATQAEVYSLAERKNLPPDYVERNLDKVKRTDVNYDEIPPVLRRFLSDPRNAAVSHDDIGALGHVENVLRSMPEGFTQSFGMAFEGAGRLLDAGGRTVARGLDAALPESMDRFIWESEKTPAWAKIDPADALRWQGSGLKQFASTIGVPEGQRNLATDISGGVGQAAGQIVTYLMSPQVGMTSLFAQGVDQQGERQEATGTEGESLASDLALVAGGAATAATEKLGIDVLLNRIPPAIKNKIAQQVADLALAGGAEAVQEVSEGIAQGLIEQYTTNPDVQIFEGLDREAITAGGVGVILRGIVNAATPARMRGDSEVIQEIADSAKASKVASPSRSPQEFIKYVEQIQEEYGTVDNMYLDADQARTLFQDMKQDPAYDLIAAQIEEAEAVGGDIVIPMGEFTTKVAQSENFGLLKPYLRLTPERPSQPQDIDTLLKDAAENAEIKQRADQIYKEVSDQLVSTKRMSREDARISASIIPAYVTSRAARSGLSADEVYEMMGLQIVGPQAEVSGQAIMDQPPAYTDAPVVFDEVKNRFLELLPEDAGIDEVMEELGRFSTQQRNFIKALDRDNWLGFDSPAQAISAALSGEIDGFEVSVGLKQAIGKLVNAPYTLYQAKTEGYEGQNPFEAQEWVKAKQKGLDMSTEARMARAKELGFDTDQVFYHGTASVFDAFSKKKSQDKEGRKLGMGWGKDKFYFADTGEAASVSAEFAEMAGRGDTQNVIPVRLIMQKSINADEYMDMVNSEMEGGVSRDKAISAVDKRLKGQGYDSIVSDVGGYAVFEPSQIRSVNAAFDPDQKDSPKLLAQMFPESNRVTELSSSIQEKIKSDNPSLKDVDLSKNPEITVYRATIGESLRKDDFVAVERDIAEQHLENLRDRGEEGSIIEQKVKVGDLLMANDSTEFVYWPEKIMNQSSFTPEDLEFFKSQGLLTDEEASNLVDDELEADTQPDSARTISGKVPERQWAEATAIQTDGKPANVYRGAATKLSQEDFQNLGKSTGHPSASLGVWFTTDQADAATYGTPSEYQLDIRNPKVYNLNESMPALDSADDYTKLRKDLESQGHDGIVLDYSEVGGPTHIVSFQPDQVVEPARVLQQSNKGLPNLDTLFHPAVPTKDDLDNHSRIESVPIDSVVQVESAEKRKKSPGSPGALIEGYGDMPVAALRSDGVYVLFDGHHRTESALLGGEKYINMHIIDVKSYDPTSDKKPSSRKEISNEELLSQLLQDSKKGPRGLISILPKQTIIKLTEASDPTTFLHESGHLFLEMEGKLFNHPKATDQIKMDGQAILDWLGADSFDNITVEQHEKWARGFEKYLGEGKAPSVELQSAFRRFSAWIKRVYTNLKNLNVDLNDDIRQVMDRMLATDEQIARVQQNFEPLFTSAEDAGMTKAEYLAYRDQGSEQAKEQLQSKLLKELERQHKKWWKDELASVKKQVRKEFVQKPEYLAEHFFKHGDWIGKGTAPQGLSELDKLNLEQVKELYSSIPLRLRGIASKDGFDIDAAAQLFGFASGSDMLTAINDSLPLNRAINETAQQTMLERHGDALTDGTLQKKAEQAVHNLEQGKRLLSELQALSRRTGRPVADREVMKEYAKSKIGEMRYKDIKPNQYLAAEKRAGKDAVIAKERGDMETAQKHKTQELINFYLWKEANSAKDKGEKINAYLKGIQSRDYKNAKIDKDYVAKAKQLIAAYDFRKGVRDSEELAKARLEAVRNWIESQQQDPENNAGFVEASILGRLVPRKEMTVDDLTGLNDVVKSIMFGGRRNAEAEQEVFKQNIEKGVESLQENRIETYKDDDEGTPFVKAKRLLNEGAAMLRKMESLAREADGMNEQGWMWKNTIKPLLDAANQSLAMRVKSGQELRELFSGYSGMFNTLRGRKTFTLDSGRKLTLSRGGRISFALNMGNDGNMAALRDMAELPLTEGDIKKIAGSLTDSEWDLVQNLWDYIDSYWPMIADLELKRSGVAPQKVKPTPFVTPSGKQMKGGYYPLNGDPATDLTQADQDVSQQAELMKQGGTARKSTKHGSTIERVGFGGKRIDFSIDVLFNHIDGIIHDVTHWEAVRNVDRVLRNKSVQKELKTSLGNEGVNAFKQRLLEVAAGPQKINGLRGAQRVLRHARLAATYNALGYSVRTALMNTLGVTTAISDMDARSVAAGAKEFYSRPNEMGEFITEKSVYMRERGQVLNRDIAYIRANLKGDNFYTKFRDHSFWLMTQTDKAVTRPIWLAAYRKGETMFETEQEVIDYADRMVARTQGSGFDMDLAGVENRNEFVRQFTVMYSAFSAIHNIMVEQIKKKKAGKISSYELAASMSWLLVIPAIIEMMMLGGSDEEEPEDKALDYAGTVLNYGLGTLPFVREIGSARKYGQAFPSPLMQLGLAPFEFKDQAVQGELDKGLLRALGSTASLFHVPGGAQATRTFGYLVELQDGEVETFSPYELLVTGKEK